MVTKQLVTALEKNLSVQIRLYEQLMHLSAKEYGAVLSMNTELLWSVSQERSKVIEEIEIAEKSRREIVMESFGRTSLLLSKLVGDLVVGPEITIEMKQRLAKLIDQLRDRVSEARKLSAELQSISSFGLGLVNGCLSFFHAAKQVRSEVYSYRGLVMEKISPRYSRSELIIKQA